MPNLPANHDTPLRALPDKANLTPIEVARYLDISLAHVYDLVRNNAIPHRRIGKKIIRINRQEFLAWYQPAQYALPLVDKHSN